MLQAEQLETLAQHIAIWARELGFADVGIADLNLSNESERIHAWLAKRYNGDMAWLEENLDKRLQPELLVEGVCRSICVRLNYLPHDTELIKTLKSPEKAYVSRYALGRDYHKLIRKRLAKLAEKIESFALEHSVETIAISQRPFVDSAPVLERPLAAKAGLGWTGKHTLIINKEEGSWFFLGELLTNIPLPINTNLAANACGDCEACLKVCPTDAFPRPYELDARRCISYLTIENKEAIPLEFREAIGNRVFGCDDCQAICPWNKYAKPTCESDFQPRHGLANSDLLTLFNWSEDEFNKRTEGSPIRRIGYERWQRNLAVGLGNAPSQEAILDALETKKETSSPLVSEHIHWAIEQQQNPNRTRKRKIKNPEKHPSF